MVNVFLVCLSCTMINVAVDLCFNPQRPWSLLRLYLESTFVLRLLVWSTDQNNAPKDVGNEFTF